MRQAKRLIWAENFSSMSMRILWHVTWSCVTSAEECAILTWRPGSILELYSQKCVGPRTNPLGTPYATVGVDAIQTAKMTPCVMSLNKHSMVEHVECLTPIRKVFFLLCFQGSYLRKTTAIVMEHNSSNLKISDNWIIYCIAYYIAFHLITLSRIGLHCIALHFIIPLWRGITSFTLFSYITL